MTTTTKSLVVLGAGTAGTMVVNKLRHRLPASEWHITVIDKDDVHDYQPGYLFLPFGLIEPEHVIELLDMRQGRFADADDSDRF